MSSLDAYRPLLALHEHVERVLTRLAAKRDGTNARKALGNEGEREAYFFLRRSGYTVVATQWRAPNLSGELDLIAWHGETLCFIEVKTRSADDRYAPGYRMNPRKCDMLRRMARAYVQGLPWRGNAVQWPAMRFDLVSVTRDGKRWSVEHRPAVFPATT